jgi:hypothetical protein
MDIPRPDNFNETYLYEGTPPSLVYVPPQSRPPLTPPLQS